MESRHKAKPLLARPFIALRFSLRGLAAAWRHEVAFRLEVLMVMVLWPIGFFAGRTPVERTLLIGMANALNHESHLCGVMAAEEPDPGLKKFLLATEQRYQALHELAVDLLERVHFKDGAAAKAEP